MTEEYSSLVPSIEVTFPAGNAVNYPQVLEQIAKEGWEYAPVFTMKFHAKERKMDLVRRRRWHRKMVQDDPSAPAVFHIDSGGDVSDIHVTFECKVVSL